MYALCVAVHCFLILAVIIAVAVEFRFLLRDVENNISNIFLFFSVSALVVFVGVGVLASIIWFLTYCREQTGWLWQITITMLTAPTFVWLFWGKCMRVFDEVVGHRNYDYVIGQHGGAH